LYQHDLENLEKSIKSEDDAVNCTVEFFNRTSGPIQIFWIDYEGHQQDYGRVEPNSSWNQDSCVTWPWIIRQNGKNVCIYVPQFGLRDNAHVTLTVNDGGHCVLGGDATPSMPQMRTSHMRSSRQFSEPRQYETRGAPIESHTIERRGEQSYGETYVGSENVRHNNLPDVVNRPSIHRNTEQKNVNYNVERHHVNERYVDKFVDVIIEKPVGVNREVDVPYDVYVEKPIEKIIEKEMIREVYVDKIYDRYVINPVQKIVEVEVEKIIEKPVYIDEIHEVPTERIIETYVEEVIENICYEDSTVEIDERDIHKYRGSTILPTRVETYREDVQVERPVYVENIIEKIVEQPYDNIIENHVEHKCERHVEYMVERPVYKDNIIIQTVEVERPYTTRVNKEYHIEKPVHVDRIVTREVPVAHHIEHVREVERVEHVDRPREVVYETFVDKWYEKEVTVERPVHTPIYRDNIIRKPYYTTQTVEKPVENIVHRHYDVIVEQEVPVEHVRYETIERPYDNVIECPIEKVIEHEYERVHEEPVYTENIIEREVVHENVVHDYVDNIVERAVHKDNIIEQEVVIENTVRKPVETVVEHECKVEIVSYIEVPVDVVIERPVQVPYYVEREVIVENRIEQPKTKITEIETEVDHDLKHHLEKCKEIKDDLKKENQVYKDACEEIENKWRSMQSGHTDWMAQCARARRQIVETELALSKLAHRVHQKGHTKEKTTTVKYSEDPEAAKLRQEIKDQSTENAKLRSKINFHNQRTSEYTQKRSISPTRSILKSETPRRTADASMYSSHLRDSNGFDNHHPSRRLVDTPVYSSHAKPSNYGEQITSTRASRVSHPLTSNLTFGDSRPAHHAPTYGSRAMPTHSNPRYSSLASPNGLLSTSIKR